METLPPPAPPKRPGIISLNVKTAEKDYDAQSPTELSCKEGDIVYILSDSGDMWKCKIGRNEGLIPRSILENSSTIDFPLHEAAKRGNLNWLKELVMTGISVNTLDKAGNSPLYWACRFGHLECVKVLVAANPVLIQQNKLGDTILHGASWGGHSKILSFLLTLPGVSNLIPVTNKSGQTAYQLAKTIECGALLQSSGYAHVLESQESIVKDGDESD